MSNISKMLGKMFVGPATVSPSAKFAAHYLTYCTALQVALHSYQRAMYFPALACIWSLVMYCIFHKWQGQFGATVPAGTFNDAADEGLALLELEESALAGADTERVRLGTLSQSPPNYSSIEDADNGVPPDTPLKYSPLVRQSSTALSRHDR
jgi:hypothetical protein